MRIIEVFSRGNLAPPCRVEDDPKTAAYATICCNYGTNASPKLY
jgi:hypothetical protein